ncbi:MAG: hypothetical protein EXQ86_05590 [Rhodospirillales bacterium]|nr:hypothetical protein [Rhodospirillales bacterium]
MAIAISGLDRDEAVQGLSSALTEWKADDTTVEALKGRIERYLGHAGIERQDTRQKVHELWSDFVDRNIDSIGGMTMNERLWSFGLFERFDLAASEEQKALLYKKLMARP